MSTAALLGEIASRADSSNAHVIGEAFRLASVTCPNCLFPQHVDRFFALKAEYEAANKDYYRERTSYERGAPVSATGGCLLVSWHSVSRWLHRAKETRRRLKVYWPCADCIQRYNPTNRIAHPRCNLPEPKGFLE